MIETISSDDEEQETKQIAQALTETDYVDSMTDISGVSEDKAQRLREAGYHSLAHLYAADEEDLAEIKGIGNALAARIILDLPR